MKRGWRDAWFIVKQEFRTSPIGLLLTLLFMVYLSVMTYPMVQMVFDKDVGIISTILMDFYLVLIFLSLGNLMNRRSTRYLSDDSYRKYVIKQRILPIGIETIVRARYLQLCILALVNGTVFFFVSYFVTGLGEITTIGSYVLFVLIGLTLNVLINVFLTYCEWRMSGKNYMWVVFLVMGIHTVAAIIISLCGGSIFKSLIYITNEWPIPTAIVTIVVLSQAIVWGMKSSLQVLRRTDLS
ncbi:hypothetical protein NQ117_15835 [Paenibacillus sp. SC116]|uniref:hypothetical protein n=1 Tax=Paenibacillus sp. SC116 TaxID=2968986 RepID=UPI00215A8F92|nr:hypothetical protein [Paenibacillus sp. SC116]MCR8845154.1 hypothetical protein [Paenibacillus sp. SC116]